MIFNSIDETYAYINTLLEKDITIYEKHIKKICELNNISIKKESYIDGKSYTAKVDSIILKDGELEVIYEKQSWLKHIPTLYHENDFLKRFLSGFQQTHQVIEGQIDNISEQFRADKTNYIDWLASWLGVTISNDVEDTAKRRLVSDMVRLYSIRGTKRYFIDIIKHLTDVKVRMENVTEYKKVHHNLVKKDFRKKLINVYIDERISTKKSIEDKKLHFIQMILEHEKPIGTKYKIIYEFKDEPLEPINLNIQKEESLKIDKVQHLEPVSEKIEELKEEFNKGIKETKEEQKDENSSVDNIEKPQEDKNNLEEKEEIKKQDSETKKSQEEKLFKIDNEVDDYYNYDNLE